MASIPVHSLSSLDGTASPGTWEPIQAQRNSILDMSNPNFPRHIILDSSGVVITAGARQPVHLSLASILKAALTANPLLTSPPVITQQPKPVSCKAGDSVTFSMVVMSKEIPLNDPQWEAITKGLKDFSPLLGETKYTLILTADENMNGNQYRCVASSAAGSTASKPATLTVT